MTFQINKSLASLKAGQLFGKNLVSEMKFRYKDPLEHLVKYCLGASTCTFRNGPGDVFSIAQR